ncbi:MAG: cupin domain-containing protein [Sedimentisphaerales bacterium]|nr:cupin domain-containing protein [Sedimentisphaerales bacterium]
MANNFANFNTMEVVSPIKGVTVKSVHLDNVMMTYMEFTAGSVLPEHKHPQEQITTIIEGEMEMIVGKQKQVMQLGDVVTVPPNVLHSARVVEGNAIAIDA